MENFFEKELKKRCENTPYHDLYLQWQTTKNSIPEFLSLIINVFPHFTLHDSSHSENILSNIKKFLPENSILRLTTTDIWMLLFAAYFHDIGMYVSKDDYKEIIENKAFLEFIKGVQGDSNNPLREYANFFKIINNELKYKAESISMKSVYSLKYLIAGFLRNKHAERSKDIINNKSFIYLPASIPSRIVDLLAEICQSHNEKNDRILNFNKIEDGFLDDYCHPRFIACMLRLGDILDIENNRFSNIILNTLPSTPTDSLIHYDKHRSIKEKKITCTEISLTARCNNIETGELTNTWFRQISEELEFQTRNWQDIVPYEEFPSLPAIKKLDVYIADYDLIKGNKVPSFSFDSSKALSIIQGEGFYNSKFIFIRELLQNATDATYLRIFAEKNEQVKDDLDEFRKECKKHEIVVNINQNKSDDSILEFSIKDQGLGIDQNDLESIISNGRKNNKKTELIKKMPEWMRPSGIFGIGLHSIFIVTNKFHIKSTKLNSGKKLSVLLFSPTSSKKGSVYTKTLSSSVFDVPGTDISFYFKTIKLPDRITFSDKHPSLSKVFENHDFLNYSTENFELTQIIDEIFEFAYNSYIPIKLYIDNQQINLQQQDYEFSFFDKQNNYEINLRPYGYRNRVYYRNQIIRKFYPSHGYFSYDVNILSNSAKEILQINRDNLKNEYIHTFYEKTEKCIEEYSNKYINEEKELAPFMAMNLESKGLLKDGLQHIWENHKLIDEKNTEHSIGQIIKSDKIIFERDSSLQFDEIKLQHNKNEYTLICSKDTPETLFLKTKLNKKYYLSWDSNNIIIYTKSKPSNLILNKKAFIREIKQQPNARCLIPCEEKYLCLAVTKESLKHFPWAYIIPQFFIVDNDKVNLMIMPYRKVQYYKNNEYKIELEKTLNENFFSTVYPHLMDKSITKDKMEEQYSTFCREFDEMLKPNTL